MLYDPTSCGSASRSVRRNMSESANDGRSSLTERMHVVSDRTLNG